MKGHLFEVTFPCDQAGLESLFQGISTENRYLSASLVQALASREYGSASRLLRQLADIEPAYRSRCSLLAAFCYFLNDDFVNAIPIFRELHQQNDGDLQLHTLLGMAYHYVGLPGRANTHWWAAHQIERNELILKLMERFFSDEHHPERLALVPVCRGKGIDVGCGHRKTHPSAIGVDLTPGGEKGKVGNVSGQISAADITGSGDNLWMFPDNDLDYVVQRHNLEHYKDFLLALQEWKRVLKPGGILGMVVPDDEECDTLRLDPTHFHVFTMSSLQRAVDLIGGFRTCHMAKLLRRWSFVAVFQKVGPQETEMTAAFDYRSAVRSFEIHQLLQKALAYESVDDSAMAAQCRHFAEELAANPSLSEAR